MKALVYGAKISGKGAYKLLKSLGYDVEYISDDSDITMLDGVDMVVLSPNVPLDRPIVVKAKELDIEVIGEIELGYRYTKGEIIAITGTNGKTTTSMMMDAILREANISHHLLGNIGKSLSYHVSNIKKGDKVILETSSYQLESIDTFAPHVAIMLNLSVDHIERHGAFENYTHIKSKIFSNQASSDIAIINADDEIVNEISSSIIAQRYYFSLKDRVYGAYVKDKFVYYMDEKLFSIKDTHIEGVHNIANALPCIIYSKLLGIGNAVILRALRNFSLPPHRIQFIGKYKGKKYYNDSKATNIDATIVAIKTMRGSTCLILGGYDKGISYRKLIDNFDKSIRSVVIFGQNRRKIEEEIKDMDIRYFVVDTLLRAIKRAAKERVENVLFSPATSSYDMFANYEERGDMFIKLVGDINEE